MKPISSREHSQAIAILPLRLCGLVILAGVSLSLCPQAPAQSKPASDTAEVIGTWEGESQCVVPDSPCHEEHVIYEITLDKDKSAPAPLKMDGYKLVNGERIFMGTLRCDYDSAKKNLSCTSRGKNLDDWQYTVSGNTLQGTLTIDAGKAVYRKITVRKNPKN